MASNHRHNHRLRHCHFYHLVLRALRKCDLIIHAANSTDLRVSSAAVQNAAAAASPASTDAVRPLETKMPDTNKLLRPSNTANMAHRSR
jgi:hypothetical protein